jgi:hypothetical protein
MNVIPSNFFTFDCPRLGMFYILNGLNGESATPAAVYKHPVSKTNKAV